MTLQKYCKRISCEIRSIETAQCNNANGKKFGYKKRGNSTTANNSTLQNCNINTVLLICRHL